MASGGPITPSNARFLAMPVPVALHILSAIPFSILGALQFSAALRRRWRGWHRKVGRFLVVFGIATALTGLWMAQFYPWPAGDAEAVYLPRLVFGSAMLFSIGRAVVAIGRREFASHGDWMIRGYAIGLGAGTQVLTQVPWMLLIGAPTQLARSVLMGAGWVINVAVAEWVIRSARAS